MENIKTYQDFMALSEPQKISVLHRLKIGEYVEIAHCAITLTRVIGGWIYTDGNGSTAPSLCFVPEDKEERNV